MIPYTWMGALALVVFWTNTLLIVSVALKKAAWIRRHRMPPVLPAPRSGWGVARVEVTRGDGPDAALAQHRIEQRGKRFSSATPTVGWHDRFFESRVFGGAAEWDGATLRIEPGSEPGSVEVWPDRGEQLGRATDRDASTFEAVLARASKSKGEIRDVVVSVRPGDSVWVAGAFEAASDGDGWLVRPTGDAPLVVSQVDLHAWGHRSRRRLFAFSALASTLAGVITALCFVPPAFGLVSTLGGASALAFFLLVQPAGTWIRDLTLPPPHRPLEGEWIQAPS